MYPSCVEYHFKMRLIMGYKLLVLMSFEVTTVTSMDSQEPSPAVMMATCGLLNEHAAYLNNKACFGGAKFDRGWD